MAYGLTIRRGGPYNRLAEPGWQDPLDIIYSLINGGRWNPAGRFGALYLNRTLVMARAQAGHKLAGSPYGVEDLDETEQHDLVEVDVPDAQYLDCISHQGLQAVGLPAAYPQGRDRTGVPWEDCQRVGEAARDDASPGVACRSAAVGTPASEEELAVFDTHADGVVMTARRPFADWYYT